MGGDLLVASGPTGTTMTIVLDTGELGARPQQDLTKLSGKGLIAAQRIEAGRVEPAVKFGTT